MFNFLKKKDKASFQESQQSSFGNNNLFPEAPPNDFGQQPAFPQDNAPSHEIDWTQMPPDLNTGFNTQDQPTQAQPAPVQEQQMPFQAPPEQQAQPAPAAPYQPVDTSDIDALFAEENIEAPTADDFGIKPGKKFELPDFDDDTRSIIRQNKPELAGKHDGENDGFFTTASKQQPISYLPEEEPERYGFDWFIRGDNYRAVLTILNDYEKRINEIETSYLELVKGVQKQKITYDDTYLLLDSAQENLIKVDNLLFGE